MKRKGYQEERSEPSKFTHSRYSPARAGMGEREQIGPRGLLKTTHPDIKKKSPPQRMRIEPPGKIVDPKYAWATTSTIIARLRNRKGMLEANKALIERFINDARMGKTIRRGAKKRVGALRQAKYVHDLAKIDAFLKKPLDQVTEPDMERFIMALEDGEITQANGKAYAPETAVAIKKIVIKFYTWLNGGETPPFVRWIDTSFKIPDFKMVSKDQVEKILSLMSGPSPTYTIRNRAIVMFLFDSGARADELLNVRISHLEVREGQYWVRIEHSKSKPRTIVLPFCKKYLDAWLDIHPGREIQEAQLFPMRYNGLCNTVKSAGKTINAHTTPQVLRKSSSTYWSTHLTSFQLNYRLGWSMSSKQPARYIDRAGVGQEKVVETVKTETKKALEVQNAELLQRLAIMEEQFNRLMSGDLEEVKRIIALVEAKQE